MVMVSSVNGKITKRDNPDVSAFASKEDAGLFLALKERHRCYIMGSVTFEAARKNIILRKGKLRVVKTHEPAKYKAETVPGRLEFTDKEPEALLKFLESRGYNSVLLLGGATISSLFLKAGLVDEIRLTVEPALFGKGKDMIDGDVDVRLRLKAIKKLNKAGTLHLVYNVIR